MSHRAFGFAAPGSHELDPCESAELARAVDVLLDDGSIRAILRDWAERGVTNTKGNPWQRGSLRRLLKNPRIAGSIVDQGKWERLQAMLDSPSRRTSQTAPRDTTRRYLATGGLTRCGLCGAPMQGHATDRGSRTYVCQREPGKAACGRVRISADAYEDDLAVKALALLASPGIRQQIAPTEHELAAIPERISDHVAVLSELDGDLTEGVIDHDEWERRRDLVKARIRELRAVQELAQTADSLFTEIAADVEMTPETLADWWDTNTVQRRHELIALVLDHALIHPAIPGYAGYQPGRVEFVWRVQYSNGQIDGQVDGQVVRYDAAIPETVTGTVTGTEAEAV